MKAWFVPVFVGVLLFFALNTFFPEAGFADRYATLVGIVVAAWAFFRFVVKWRV